MSKNLQWGRRLRIFGQGKKDAVRVCFVLRQR